MKTLREVLDSIDAVLAGGYDRELARELWAVLTALRGPDHYDPKTGDDLKHNSTAIIRAVAFPMTARSTDALPADFRAGESRVKVPYVQDSSPELTHFLYHTQDAAVALGLGVDR